MMDKKIIFKIFIISFVSVLSIDKLISSDDETALSDHKTSNRLRDSHSSEDDQISLLHCESSNGLRLRKQPQSKDRGIELKKTFVQEQELESHDDVFSSIGEGWDFFKQGDYEKAYAPICLSSQAKNYAARYLVARFYEFGLAGKKADSVIAAKFYSSVFANSNNPFLKSESEKGLARMIALTKGKF